MFRGIAAEKATGLSAVASWDSGSMWSSLSHQPSGTDADKSTGWIARSADLQIRSSAFENSLASLHRIVSAHHGYLEDLRTESRTGSGRALAAIVSVPTEEFENTRKDLKTLGRVGADSEAGEDTAVRLATSVRHLEAAKTNLARLQKLQHERKGELRDAVALEKDIAQADESVSEAERRHSELVSTVAQAHFRVALLEDYRAPLRVNLEGAFLQVRNSLMDGIVTIVSSVCAAVGILFSYGLPAVFWLALLFCPFRLIWRRWRCGPAPSAAA